ncbi:hypothetical protein, partial [Pulveribacter sp.]|uniref:hypothetical protein n=1 Tax=Pulveribacter sp. TaxID=2678893 RepID=UPI003917E813
MEISYEKKKAAPCAACLPEKAGNSEGARIRKGVPGAREAASGGRRRAARDQRRRRGDGDGR